MAKSNVGAYKDLVKELLTKYEWLRDDIDDLYLACISAEMGKDFIRNTSLYDFFHIIKKDKSKVLPAMSSIVRLNADIQTKYPELRGKLYYEKRGIVAENVKEDLGYGK